MWEHFGLWFYPDNFPVCIGMNSTDTITVLKLTFALDFYKFYLMSSTIHSTNIIKYLLWQAVGRHIMKLHARRQTDTQEDREIQYVLQTINSRRNFWFLLDGKV